MCEGETRAFMREEIASRGGIFYNFFNLIATCTAEATLFDCILIYYG